jgi:aminoglycoside 3-N-acetyltransferase
MQDVEVLYNDLIRLFDLKENDTVMVSSDVTRLALQFKSRGVAFSVDRFVDHLQAVLVNGTIIIPAYTDNLKNGDTFDRQKSKPTTGAVSNRIMRRKDFQRTKDPLHSVLVWGKGADNLLSLHDKSTFGPNSVFGFMERVNAKMIIIDVHFENSFTYVHFIEEKLKVKFRKPFLLNMKIIDQGVECQEGIIFYTKSPGYTVDLKILQDKLIKEGVVKRTKFLDIPILTMELKKTGRAVEDFINSGGKTYGFDLKLYVKHLIKKLIGRK